MENKKLQILHTVTQAVHKSHDLDEIYKVALDMATELDNVDMACIYLVDGNRENAVLQARRNFSEEYIRNAGSIPHPKGVTWKVINTGKTINIENIQEDPVIGQAGRDLGPHSVLGIPITSGEEVTGVIWFLSYKERRFEEEEVALLTSIGNQIATAIAKAKLYSDLTKKSRYEEIIRTITQNVHRSIDLQEVLYNAAESLSKNIEIAQHVCIFMIEGEDAVLKATRGMPEWFVEQLKMISYPKGLTWKVLTDGNPRYCPDVEQDKYIGAAGRKVGTKSYLSVPFHYLGKPIGCITLHSFEKNAFNDDEINLLKIVAQQIETAISNAKHVEALAQSEERYRILFDQSPVGVYLFDTDLKITNCNQRMVQMLQSSRDKIIGLDMMKLKDKSFIPAMEKATKGQPSYHEGFYEATTSSAKLWLSLYFSPLRDSQGNVVGGMSVAENITERKQVEEELLARTSQLTAVTDAMTILLDRGNWQAACNSLLKHALHLTESEYGFIGVVMEVSSELRIFAHSGLDWDRNVNHEFYEHALRFYEEMGYLVFTNFDNLFGQVITTGQVVISNNPSSDPRAGGLPPGHPPLHSFLGVPILRETEVVGLVGVANSPGGYTSNDKGKIEILSHAASVLDDNYRRREREAALENERKRAELQLRKSREELRAFTARQESIREEERTRIAREIHDELGETLTGLKIDLSFLQKRLPNNQDSLHERVQSMSDLASSAIKAVQKISTELRPVVLDELGLTAAIEWQAREFETRTGIKSILTLPSSDITLGSELSTAVFRIFQETLTNVARHAHASQVSVSLKAKSGNLILNVEDNGRGIRESEISSSKSMGLIGIRERVYLLGGEFEIAGSEGEGTTLIVSVPLGRKGGCE